MKSPNKDFNIFRYTHHFITFSLLACILYFVFIGNLFLIFLFTSILLFFNIFRQIYNLFLQSRKKAQGRQIRLQLIGYFSLMAVIIPVIFLILSNWLFNFTLDQSKEGVDRSYKIIAEMQDNARGKIGYNSLARHSETLCSSYKENPKMYLAGAVTNGVDFVILYESVNSGAIESASKKNTLLKSAGNRDLISAIDLDKDIQDVTNNPKLSTSESFIYYQCVVDEKASTTFLLIGKHVDKELLNEEKLSFSLQAEIQKMRDLTFPVGGSTFQLMIVSISLLILLLTIIVSIRLSSRFVEPIQELIIGTERVKEGNFQYNIPEKGVDEFMHLIQSFNQMTLELYNNKKRLYEAEKIAAWREVAKRLAHEVKNPLTPIKLASERLLRLFYKDKEKFESILESSMMLIIEEVDRLKNLVNEFSDFSKMPKVVKTKESISKLCEDLFFFYKESQPQINFHLNDTLEDQERVLDMDGPKVKQVLINLLENAIAALSENKNGKHPAINLTIDRNRGHHSHFIRIRLKDNGNGIPDDLQENIFTPYFTTKSNGNGLGLVIAKSIIEEHGGTMGFTSQESVGTEFTIELPRKIMTPVSS